MSGYRLVVGQERLVKGREVDEGATSKPQPQPRLRLQLLSSLCYERMLLGLLCLLLGLAVLCLLCLAVLLPPLLTAAFLSVQQQTQLPSLPPFLLVNSTSTLPTFLSSSYFPSSPHTSLSFPPVLLSDLRGYVAVQYTGTARTWSAVFYSHLLHLICSSPFTVHLYFVIMVLDDSSEHLSVKATLDRYERCMNLDNQSVSIGERVQGWRMQRQSDIDDAHDFDELKRYHNRTGQTLQDNALRQYWAFHEVDRMREEVQQRLDIRYSWVIKQRTDALQITDLWSSLYHVSPVWDFVTAASATHQPTPPNSTTHSPDADAASVTTARARRLSSLRLDAQPLLDLSAGLAEADGNPLFLPSYVVGESVFTPRASSAVVNVPVCDSWFGHSDQFAAANSDIMSVYYRRGYPPYSSRVAELPTNIVPFNTESYLFLAMRAHNIDSAYVQEHWEASRGVRPRQKECTCAVDTWATVARGRGATGEATLHGGRESAWTALQLTALHHHLLASKLTLSNTQLISSMPRHPGYDVTGYGPVERSDLPLCAIDTPPLSHSASSCTAPTRDITLATRRTHTRSLHSGAEFTLSPNFPHQL